MNSPDIDLETLRAYVTAGVELQELELPPERVEAVLQQFKLLADMHQRTQAIALPNDIEPAPVYRP